MSSAGETVFFRSEEMSQTCERVDRTDETGVKAEGYGTKSDIKSLSHPVSTGRQAEKYLLKIVCP